MREPLLDKLDRKIGRFAPRHLLTVLVIGTAVVWLLNYIVYMNTGVFIDWYIDFNKEAILQGQVWRLVTFLFVSTEFNPFLLAISLYFYWIIGRALENTWGAFKFDLFYLCGILCAIGSGFITGYATVYYLNLSMFLAFAVLYPNHQVLLFFFIPIKMKWLAIVDLAGIVLLLIFNSWAGRIAIFVALFNVALFVVGGWIRNIMAWRATRKWRKGLHVVEDEEKVKVKKENTKRKRRGEDDPFEL